MATLAPHLLAGLAFAVLFWAPMTNTAGEIWSNPDAGHGLLLIPLAGWLAWKRGMAPERSAARVLGLSMLATAVVFRYAGGLAAELFTMRIAMVLALAGLIVFHFGARQLMHWWLPAVLVVLSMPLPVVVTGTLALPLQFMASQMGAALLEMRHVPVLLEGNVLRIPGQTLFVTEACSGLRSLTALIALGVLIGGMWLHYPVSRVLLVALAIPVAMVLNGIRVFLTGFLVYFVDPSLGEGFMHMTEGWVIFVAAFAILGGFAWVLLQGEGIVRRRAA
jgi:exosortase